MKKRRAARPRGKSKDISGPKSASPERHNPNAVMARLDKIRERRNAEFTSASHRIVYWASLLVLLICNLTVSIVLIPFVLALSSFKFYFLMALLGLIFGWLFSILINDIEHIETKHHVFAVVFIPLVALVNIMIMVSVANRIAGVIGIPRFQDPFLPSLLYTFFFLLPFSVTIVKKDLKKDKHHHIEFGAG